MTEFRKITEMEDSLRKYRGEMSFSGRYQPLIGISGNFKDMNCTLAMPYWNSVIAAGGIPVIIPPFDDVTSISHLTLQLDGIILSGGADIDPEYLREQPLCELSVNPTRDLPEMLLTRIAFDRRIPILGICRGIQTLAAALGGKLYQDISQHGEVISHDQDTPRDSTSHTVAIKQDSLLRTLFGNDTLHVNSFHHQAVKTVPEGFMVSATAADGIIEAMESTSGRSILGVQWHPECLLQSDQESMLPIFRWLVAQASSYKEAKDIHNRSIILDSHCDTPMFFDKGAYFHKRDESIAVEYEYVGETSPDGSETFLYTPLVSLQKMTDGNQDVSVMVAYLRQLKRDEASLNAATQKADRILSLIEDRVRLCGGEVAIARTPSEVRQNKQLGIKSIVLGIENGYAIGNRPDNIRRYAKMGVSYITLCHNGDNDICDSAKGESEHNGLSAFGEQVIREMNKYGIMVDLSHASEKSFYDAANTSKTPIICSHSSVRALCNHPRNLTDEQMMLLAHSGGVAQVCLYSGFLKKGGNATIHDAVRHIKYMVNVMGIEHVGIGSDFDGGGGIMGLEDASALLELTRLLISEGFSHRDLQLLWGENFLNVWERIQRESLLPR